MEDLPHELLVDLLRRVPRASLLDVAQTSTTLLRAASDDRLWRPTVARPDGVADPDGLAGTARRDGGAIRASVARWIATLLRFPHQALLPLLRLEAESSRFHVTLSCHPIRAHLAVAEALRPKTSSTSSPSPSRAHTHADLARRHPEDALLLSLGAAERVSSALLSEASANDPAARLADLLRDDADAARSNARGRGRGTGAQGGADVGADVEAVRAERGRVRLRFAPEAIVALVAGTPTPPSRAPTASAPTSAPVPPWTRGLDGVGVHASAGAVARLPRPATPWSTLRAAIVGESLRALDDGFGPARFAERAWGPAARTARAAADGRLHEQLLLLRLHEQNPAGVGSNPADPRAGVAWPALAADPRLRGGVRTRDPSNPNRDHYRRGDRPRGFVVGGCSCGESVVAIVDGALADANPSSFLEVDAVPPDPNERAAATALALLAHAPRAHECDLDGPRFARQLGRALWTLRLRRAKFAVASEERERERERESGAPSPTGTDPSNDRGYGMDASSSLGDADAALAIRLEACEGAVMDAGEQWEPREAAAAAIDVAAAAAGAAKAVAGRGGGDDGDDDGDEDGATRARRAMLRRARDCVERCLVAVGVLERLEGDG